MQWWDETPSKFIGVQSHTDLALESWSASQLPHSYINEPFGNVII
jgi:hypothetical protein